MISHFKRFNAWILTPRGSRAMALFAFLCCLISMILGEPNMWIAFVMAGNWAHAEHLRVRGE